MDQLGRNYMDDIGPGDLWYFPSGIPHSIQAGENGAEVLIVFDDGISSEDGTLLVTDVRATLFFSSSPIVAAPQTRKR